MPDSADNDPPTAYAVQNNIGSAANDQLANSRLCPGPAQARVVPEGLNHGNDSRRQLFCCVRFVERHVSADFLKSRQSER